MAQAPGPRGTLPRQPYRTSLVGGSAAVARMRVQEGKRASTTGVDDGGGPGEDENHTARRPQAPKQEAASSDEDDDAPSPVVGEVARRRTRRSSDVSENERIGEDRGAGGDALPLR